MKKLLALMFVILICNNLQSSNKLVIDVNQVGYLKNLNKYGWIIGSCNTGLKWDIKQVETGNVVYSGIIKEHGTYDEASMDTVLRIDFSPFKEEGNYFIEIENLGKSFEFAISDSPYNKVFESVVKSYYYQRSGIELTPEYAGIWAKPASHTNDGYLYSGFENNKIIKGEFINCNGGWYDAGDFGKKIVPASIALYPFMKLAQFYPEIVKSANISIPNPNLTLPGLLAEAKWELDWFFAMQEINGGVHHLIVSPNFYMGPAQNDPQTRYIVTVSTTATSDFAAIMALASKVYRPYLPLFADSCLFAATKAWGYLERTPRIFPQGGYRDPEGINNTGAYIDYDDGMDERLWASAELYAATLNENYRRYFERNYTGNIKGAGNWYSTLNYAYYTWLEITSREPGNIISKEIREKVIAWANQIKERAKNKGFGSALEINDYMWGSNSTAANIGMEMLIIDKLFDTNKYENIALGQLNYLLGCNSLNLCFLSGFGTYGVRDPHQCINSYDNLTEAPPGFIPGGPNKNIDGDYLLSQYVKANKLPPAKCYLDKHGAYACNEVCVAYNSGMVFLSGFFYKIK
jgi:endoglucanase